MQGNDPSGFSPSIACAGYRTQAAKRLNLSSKNRIFTLIRRSAFSTVTDWLSVQNVRFKNRRK